MPHHSSFIPTVKQRIPPITCLEAFDVLARVRSMKKAAEVLCLSPSAVSHRMKLMESILQKRMFEDMSFSLSEDGERYLQVVRESLILLQSHSTPSHRHHDSNQSRTAELY
jgi:LysR family transcriptional regulator, glycine cleavage system transcriptional activator